MSGRTKKIVYIVFEIAVILAAFASTFVMAYFSTIKNAPKSAAISAAAVLFCVFAFTAFLHELGHLCLGLMFGMIPVSFTVRRAQFSFTQKKFRWLKRSDAEGQTQMIPKSGRGIRGKTIAYTLGGALFNFIYGGVFLALYFCVGQSFALLTFELLAPFSLMEGLLALYPTQFFAGKTDGAVALGLLKKNAEEEVFLRVTRAQGILYKKTFADIPRELLFSAPVVREDSAAFAALSLLRLQYSLYFGETSVASELAERLEGVEEFALEYAAAQIDCEISFFYALNGKTERAKELLENAVAARDTLAYERAEYVCSGGEGICNREKTIKKLQEEVFVGIKNYEEKMLAAMPASMRK